MKPTREQEAVIAAVGNGHCVKVDAVAGAGKTTTKLFIATRYPALKFLDLTYNARLKISGRAVVEARGIRNDEVHTYHSACGRYFQPGTCNDQHLLDVLENPHALPLAVPLFDAVFLDEQQDVRKELYRLQIKIIRELCVPNPLLIVLGDKFQTLYGYMGADPLYIELAPIIYPVERKWQTLEMHESRRVPSTIADFINRRLLHHERITPSRTGGRVHYLAEPYDDPKFLYKLIERFLGEGFRPDEIFVLAYSTRYNPELAEYVRNMGRNLVYVQTDDVVVNERLLRGKILFSTFHATKGLEAKVVIIHKFDSRTSSEPECPNILYVGCSRASERLVLLHGTQKSGKLYPPVGCMRLADAKTDAAPVVSRMTHPRDIAITDMIRGHDPTFIREVCRAHITVTDGEHGAGGEIKLATEVKMRWGDITYSEAVSHLYGGAATVAAEICTTGRCAVATVLAERYAFLSPLVGRTLTATDTVVITNWANAYLGGYNHQTRQIRHYKWVETPAFETAVARIVARTDRGCRYEVYARHSGVHGFIDIISEHTGVWEIKMTRTEMLEHQLQTALEMALARDTRGNLYYPLTDRHYRVEVRDPAGLLQKILANRKRVNVGMTPTEFLAVTAGIVDAYKAPVPPECTEMDGYLV